MLLLLLLLLPLLTLCKIFSKENALVHNKFKDFCHGLHISEGTTRISKQGERESKSKRETSEIRGIVVSMNGS